MVLIRSLSILVFLFIFGYPLSYLLLKDKPKELYFLLAPHCGLALLAIITTNASLLNLPMSDLVAPVLGIWFIFLVLILYWGWQRWKNEGGFNVFAMRGDTTIDATRFVPTLLFIAAFVIYALPFIFNRNLVFYAYAGSDAYAYMSTAEYQIEHGVYDAPALNAYKPYSGLIKAFTRADGEAGEYWIEKPGCMLTLAFFSSLFKSLPQTTFSPLMLCFTMLIYLSAFALARSLGFSQLLAGISAFLTTTSLSVLALSSNTYFGATITISLFPAILLVAQDMLTDRKQGILFVILFTAYFLFSPPSLLIPLAACALFLIYKAFGHLKRGDMFVIGNAIFLIVIFALLNILDYKVFFRNLVVFDILLNPGSTHGRDPMDALHLDWQWALFWHTLGIGTIMAGPGYILDSISTFAFGLILLVGALFLVRSLIRRDFSILFFAYLTFWLAVLVGGVGGSFQSFVVLNRQAEQFVPLHSLVFLSFFQIKETLFFQNKILKMCITVVLLFIVLYPFKYFYQFEKDSLVVNVQTINQYEKSSLNARRDLGEIAGQESVLLSSSVPSYTSLANIVALFSNLRLAIPIENLKFFFLENTPLPDDYYCGSLMLSPTFYNEIYEIKDEAALYKENGFILTRNDLIPIFNNETFQIKYPFDAELLDKLGYVQARILYEKTNISICSHETRQVQITFRYTPVEDEQKYDFSAKPENATRQLSFDKEGMLTVTNIPLAQGENKIELVPFSDGKIEILELSVEEEK